MQLRILRSYATQYHNPIILREGDRVVLGEEETEEKWKGWIKAAHDNISGWIPKQIVHAQPGGTGIITEYYSAKELDVEAGDEVEALKELNGWLWVKHMRTGEEGWIPKEITA